MAETKMSKCKYQSCCKCGTPATIEYARDWVGGSLAFAEFYPYCAECDPTRYNLYHRGLVAKTGAYRILHTAKYCDLCGEKVPDTRELERDGQVYQVCEDCWSELEDGK